MRQFMNIVENAAGDYPLYHGTSILSLIGILESNVMRGSNEGDYDDDAFKEVGVSFTKQHYIAVGFANEVTLRNLYDFDADDRQIGGAVLVFSAEDLRQHFKIAEEGFNSAQIAEHEVRVLGNLTDVRRHLKSVDVRPEDVAAMHGIITDYLERHPDDQQIIDLLASFSILA